MDKRQLIREIQKLNPSAADVFLELFEDSELSAYLDRLTEAHLKNLRCNPLPNLDSDAVRIAS
jgi:hypothetical protein